MLRSLRYIGVVAAIGLSTMMVAPAHAAPAHTTTTHAATIRPNAIAPVDGSLRPYRISGVYVSGVSSGGYMATQLQVAYSSKIKGAAVFAAGPYYCAENNAEFALYACADNSWPDYLSTLEADASLWSLYGWIDPTSHLSGQPVYIYHGANDTAVQGTLTSDLASFYRHFGANVQYVTGSAGHAWVTPLGPVACTSTANPYLNNCGTDPEHDFLTKLFGSVNPSNTGVLTGTLTRFQQSSYVLGGSPAGVSMNPVGFSYVPASCAAGATCKLMVALHGCDQDYDSVGTAFVDDANLNQYADTNNMIVLYPEATSNALNPYGCWDWWGYLGLTNYPIHGGLQLESIMNEIHALGG
jgi:hypothetical protein